MDYIGPNQIVSTRAIIENSGEIALLQRISTGEFKGAWELPGGKLDIGDTIQSAIFREVQEETGLEVEFLNSNPVFIEKRDILDGKHRGIPYRAYGFVAMADQRDIRTNPDEHVDYVWVHPDEATELPLTRTSAAAIRILRPLL